jgi:ketosteroid isomerase-like protein
MQAVYPGMSHDVRQAWQEFFKAQYSLDTSHWKFLEIQVNGTTASAKIGGTSIQRDKKGKTSEVAPPRAALLEKGPSGWRITSIN